MIHYPLKLANAVNGGALQEIASQLHPILENSQFEE
jgi:hypothetical protein